MDVPGLIVLYSNDSTVDPFSRILPRACSYFFLVKILYFFAASEHYKMLTLPADITAPGKRIIVPSVYIGGTYQLLLSRWFYLDEEDISHYERTLES